ncbi:zinc transporter ZIP1 isoform X2 [Lethenteron reissneri]|uniref:zinc transporter ZIP1 isoform X2 n=1 Tax=Lethenteron reissneri TaxID=7753 RepID=UPI002AB68D01|nr:zinc transporter ZIP1 isoform X2 [Lethenteron reissneri]
MEHYLEVKVIFLALLFFLTLLFGLLPLKFVRSSSSASGGQPEHGLRSRLFQLLSSTTAGVFLATCLLDLLPDYLASMQEALSDLRATTAFPLAEFILSVGFFAVMLLEQAVLSLHGRTMTLAVAASSRSSSSETRALLSPASSSPAPESPHVNAVVLHPPTASKSVAAAADPEPGRWASGGPGAPAEDADAEVGAHLHVDRSSHSAVRAWGLLISLALHSVLEGLAVGLQQPGLPGASLAGLVGLCTAVAVHKCAVASGLCVRLVQARLGRQTSFAALLGFALMSPVGVTVGIALLDSPALAESHMPRAVLQGLATGTFLYVTFLEILPHELNSQHCRLLRAVCLLVGFSVITVTLFATT